MGKKQLLKFLNINYNQKYKQNLIDQSNKN